MKTVVKTRYKHDTNEIGKTWQNQYGLVETQPKWNPEKDLLRSAEWPNGEGLTVEIYLL